MLAHQAPLVSKKRDLDMPVSARSATGRTHQNRWPDLSESVAGDLRIAGRPLGFPGRTFQNQWPDSAGTRTTVTCRIKQPSDEAGNSEIGRQARSPKAQSIVFRDEQALPCLFHTCIQIEVRIIQCLICEANQERDIHICVCKTKRSRTASAPAWCSEAI